MLTGCATQLTNAGYRITSIQKFLGHKHIFTTLTYARAYDQTAADDYFTAMSRVEQRMEIIPLTNPVENTNQEYEVVKVLEKTQILTWIDLLSLPELCQEERLEIAESLKQALFQNLIRQQAPPAAFA